MQLKVELKHLINPLISLAIKKWIIKQKYPENKDIY